ncbi:hypothetical protein BD779DRAFT_266328 [Infundibulicybe gibba]|nr:hypothetical protein BD779DRAFT_266328 [Infundibulicybe gibba]
MATLTQSSAKDMVPITGSMFVGCILNWFLFGALLIQLYDYQLIYQRRDRMFLRCAVCVVCFLELIQSVFITHTVWDVLVSGWGDPSATSKIPWSTIVTPTLVGTVSLIVQLFFAWRIWTLTENICAHAVAIVISLASIMQFGSTIAITAQYALLNHDSGKLDTLYITAKAWLYGSLACDLLITITMVTLLFLARSKLSFKPTQTLINYLIMHTMETGAITAVAAALRLIFFLTQPNSVLYVAVLFLLGKFYGNVLLTTLNGRRRARDLLNPEFTTSAAQPLRLGELSGHYTSRTEAQQDKTPPRAAFDGIHISTEIVSSVAY